MHWKIHKAKENPKKTIFVSLFLFFLLLFFFLFYGLFWTLLAFLFLFATLNSYFLPITYTLTEEGILVDKKIYKFKREWKGFKKIIVLKNGLLLSPFEKKTFLDNFRGLFIFLPEERDKVISFINEKLNLKSDQG
ncbi:MAG: hypothetical protein ABIK99_05015 [candidate division WOR-3 bacterium]